MIVYGTVIAWANEKLHDNGESARMWEVHLAEIERQGKEWRRLGDQYPVTPLIVAGDFNQDRDGSGWHGTKRTRWLLGQKLVPLVEIVVSRAAWGSAAVLLVAG